MFMIRPAPDEATENKCPDRMKKYRWQCSQALWDGSTFFGFFSSLDPSAEQTNRMTLSRETKQDRIKFVDGGCDESLEGNENDSDCSSNP